MSVCPCTKTLSLAILILIIYLHHWYLTWSTTIWRTFTAYRILHDPMIQKGVAGLRIILIKKLCRGLFSKKLLDYIVDTWLKVTYAWRPFTTYKILHDLMIQKGVAGLRIVSIKKTLPLTNFMEFIDIHWWYCTEGTTVWKSFSAYRYLMIW